MRKIALSLFVVAASGAYVWHQSGRAAADDITGLPPPTDSIQTGTIPRRAPAATAGEPAAIVRPASLVTERPAAAAFVNAPKAPSGPPVVPVLPDAKPVAGDTLASASAAEPQPLPTPADAPPVPSMPPAAPAPVAVTPLPRPRPVRVDAGPAVKATPAAMTIAANGSYADGTYTGPAADAYYGLVQVQATVQGGQLVSIRVLKYPSDRRTSVYINRQALPMLRDEVVSAQSADVDIVSGATLTSRAFIRSLGSALRKAKI